MKDIRKNVKVHPNVKFQLETIRRRLGLKTESETVDYLINAYSILLIDKITLVQHKDLLEVIENDHKQQVLL